MIQKHEQLLDELNELINNHNALLSFLLEFLPNTLLQAQELFIKNIEWKTIDNINFKQNTLVQRTTEINKQIYTHKVVAIVNNGNQEEWATSDFHGNYEDFEKILSNVVEHLEKGGVFISLGDNLGEIYREYPGKSLKTGLLMLLLMSKYPKNCFWITGNHDIDDSNRGLRSLNTEGINCSIDTELNELSCDKKTKNAIKYAFYNLVKSLPELAISEPTKTVYVHASLPESTERKLRNGKILRLRAENFSEILNTQYITKCQRCTDSITMFPAGFDENIFRDYQKRFGVRKCIKGHDHINLPHGAKIESEAEGRLMGIPIKDVHTVFSCSTRVQLLQAQNKEPPNDSYPCILINFDAETDPKFIRIDEPSAVLKTFLEDIKQKLNAYKEQHDSRSFAFFRKNPAVKEFNDIISFLNSNSEGFSTLDNSSSFIENTNSKLQTAYNGVQDKSTSLKDTFKALLNQGRALLAFLGNSNPTQKTLDPDKTITSENI